MDQQNAKLQTGELKSKLTIFEQHVDLMCLWRFLFQPLLHPHHVPHVPPGDSCFGFARWLHFWNFGGFAVPSRMDRRMQKFRF